MTTARKKTRHRSQADETYLERLGRKITRARLEANIATDEVAQRAGLHRSYYRKLEGGHVNPSTLVLRAIAEVLDRDITALLPSTK